MVYPKNNAADSPSSPLSREHILLNVDPDVMGVLAKMGFPQESWGTDSCSFSSVFDERNCTF